MKIKSLLHKMRTAIHNQRGVTLIELILVVALLTLVFGGIVTLLTSMYNSYEQTNVATANGRQATLIINQLTQDIRKSVQSPTDEPAVLIDTDNETIKIFTEKQGNSSPQTVEYRYGGEKIVYVANQMEIELAPSGTLLLDKSECETENCYKLTVWVGKGVERAEMTTTVARYDWGEN